MNRLIFIGLLILFTTGIFAQKLLLVENESSLKNYKYFQGEEIMIKFEGGNSRITDRIFDLTDSTIIFEMMGEVKMTNITCIYRENWLIDILSGFSLLAGTAYFGIDTFNRMINHEYPVVDSGTLMISAGIVAFGVALIPFRYKKIHPGDKWKLRTLDLNSY